MQSRSLLGNIKFSTACLILCSGCNCTFLSIPLQHFWLCIPNQPHAHISPPVPPAHPSHSRRCRAWPWLGFFHGAVIPTGNPFLCIPALPPAPTAPCKVLCSPWRTHSPSSYLLKSVYRIKPWFCRRDQWFDITGARVTLKWKVGRKEGWRDGQIAGQMESEMFFKSGAGN